MYSPKLLIIKPSSLGDIVHGLLVAQMIRSAWPPARIDWVCRDCFAPLVAACPVVDDIFLFQRHGGPAEFLRLVRELRRRRYGHVLDMQGLARSGLIALLVKADEIIGRSDAREGTRLVYDRRAPLPPAGRDAHAVTILAEFLPLLGLSRNVTPRLPFHPPGQPEAVQEHGLRQSILLFPESSRPEKNWAGYVALTTLLFTVLPEASVVWAGAHRLPGPCVPQAARFSNMTGQTALAELPALLATARVVVGNDSGPLHLAAAMGIPTLALFGPTDPARYRPYPGDNWFNRIVRAPRGNMEFLSPEAVLASIQEMLMELFPESG